jgi:hypothetical protein
MEHPVGHCPIMEVKKKGTNPIALNPNLIFIHAVGVKPPAPVRPLVGSHRRRRPMSSTTPSSQRSSHLCVAGYTPQTAAAFAMRWGVVTVVAAGKAGYGVMGTPWAWRSRSAARWHLVAQARMLLSPLAAKRGRPLASPARHRLTWG